MQLSCFFERHQNNFTSIPSPDSQLHHTVGEFLSHSAQDLLKGQVHSQSWNGNQEFWLSIISLTETSPMLLAQQLAKPAD